MSIPTSQFISPPPYPLVAKRFFSTSVTLFIRFLSVQFSSVALSCPTFCDPVDCSTLLPCPSTPRACSNSCPSSW